MSVQAATVPIHPDSLLNANDRLHFQKSARAVRELKQIGHLVFGRQLQPVTGRVRVVVTLRFPDDALGRSTARKRRDAANWAPTAKALVDGLTLAKIWPDDNDQWVEGPDLRIGPPSGQLRALVTVTLEPAVRVDEQSQTAMW